MKMTAKILFLKHTLEFPILYKQKKEDEEDFVYQTDESKKTTDKKKKKKQKSEKLPFPGIKNSLSFFTSSISNIFGKVVRSFRLEKLHFKAVAGAEDSAKAAELYGLFCTVASGIHQFAINAKGIKKNAVYVEVTPDFIAETLDIYCELIFSIRIFRLLFIGGGVYSVWRNYKNLAKSVLEQKNADSLSDEQEKNSNQ